MKPSKSFLSRFRFCASAIIFITLITIWNTKPAAAQIDPMRLEFVVCGITQGQTARINVLDTSDINSGFPPGPCKVELTFEYTRGGLLDAHRPERGPRILL